MVKKIKTVSVSPAMPLSKFSLLKRRQCGVRFFSAQDTVFSVQGCDLETAFANFCWQLRKI